MINRILIFCLSLFMLSACGDDSSDDATDPTSIKPEITIVEPLDTISLGDSVAVKILYSDNSGLSFTEVTLGTESGGNTVYHSSQRGLSGLNDELEFRALVPAVINITGSNYILVKCEDEDGNQSIAEKPFVVINPDNVPPQFQNVYHNGFLSRSPNTAFEIVYSLTDDKGLGRIEFSLRAWDGANLGAEFDGGTIQMNGVTSYSNVYVALGNPSYTVGAAFKVEIKAYDLAGNETRYLMPPVFNIQ
ncbi:MAG: hypothetical protein ACPGVV_09440 [Croceimicrobium sp.]